MKYYFCRIYTEDDEDTVIIVEAETAQEASAILLRDENIQFCSILSELTEEEAYNTGLDIM